MMMESLGQQQEQQEQQEQHNRPAFPFPFDLVVICLFPHLNRCDAARLLCVNKSMRSQPLKEQDVFWAQDPPRLIVSESKLRTDSVFPRAGAIQPVIAFKSYKHRVQWHFTPKAQQPRPDDQTHDQHTADDQSTTNFTTTLFDIADKFETVVDFSELLAIGTKFEFLLVSALPSSPITSELVEAVNTQKIKQLSFTGMADTNISALANVESLVLVGCHAVTDLSSLGHRTLPPTTTPPQHQKQLRQKDYDPHFKSFPQYPTLRLYNCKGITDISGVAAITSLKLTSMHNITNYWTISDVPFLKLYQIKSDLNSCFANVAVLEIMDCPNISDVSSLRHVQQLTLHGLDNVSDVSALGTVRALRILFCPLVCDVRALGEVSYLELVGLPALVDVSPLSRVRHLALEHCDQVEKVNMLQQVDRLELK